MNKSVKLSVIGSGITHQRMKSASDADFVPVYLKECGTLLQKMKKGNKKLRDKANAALANEAAQLRTNDLHS